MGKGVRWRRSERGLRAGRDGVGNVVIFPMIFRDINCVGIWIDRRISGHG